MRDPKDGKVKPSPLVERLEKERLERAEALKASKAHRSKKKATDASHDR